MSTRKYNIKVINHTRTDGHVGYNLKIEILDNNMSFMVSKRYSELKTFNDLLRKETSSNAFPKFPPKKFFGFNSEEFINKRQQELDVYFQAICASPEFTKLNSFVKFIEECKQSQNDFKIISERPTEVAGASMISSKKNAKSTVDPYRERFRPNKNEYEQLTPGDMKQKDEEFKKIVNESKNKFVDIDFQVKQNLSEKNEKKYNEIIQNDKILNNEIENVQPGNDDNFNLISDNCDNVDGAEKDIQQKIKEYMGKENEIIKIYDINEILKTL